VLTKFVAATLRQGFAPSQWLQRNCANELRVYNNGIFICGKDLGKATSLSLLFVVVMPLHIKHQDGYPLVVDVVNKEVACGDTP